LQFGQSGKAIGRMGKQSDDFGGFLIPNSKTKSTPVMTGQRFGVGQR
jgi:hypothetical protein